MQVDGATALVTGTNRGLGRDLAIELLRRGARVYATARRPELVDIPGATVLRLDITDESSVAEAAQAASDVDLLVNNAAFTGGGNFIGGDLESIRAVMESSYYGTLSMIRAFAPVLARNGGGAILNVLSAAAWTTVNGNTSYAAAKSAEWSLTNGVRLELAGQGTQVSALVPGLVATETLTDFLDAADVQLPADVMLHPAELARIAFDGLEAGEPEILDTIGRDAKASLIGPPQEFDLHAIAAR